VMVEAIIIYIWATYLTSATTRDLCYRLYRLVRTELTALYKFAPAVKYYILKAPRLSYWLTFGQAVLKRLSA
jgi:hypothetical protein